MDVSVTIQGRRLGEYRFPPQSAEILGLGLLVRWLECVYVCESLSVCPLKQL